MAQQAKQRVHRHIHQTPNVIHPQPIMILQKAEHRLRQRPLMILNHQPSRTMSPEPPVNPQHIPTPLIRRIRNHRLLNKPPNLPAAVLTVSYKTPQPSSCLTEDHPSPLYEGGRMPLLVIVSRSQ